MSFTRRFAAGPERREWVPSWLASALGVQRRGGTWAGVPVDERRALQQLTVWSCVSLISDTLSQLPIGAFRGEGAERLPVARPQLLKAPVEGVEWSEWIGSAAVSALLRGNTYGEIIDRDNRGFATQIMLLHPDDVEPVRDRDDGRVKYRLADGRRLERFEMFHVKGMTLPGALHSLKGLSPIEHAAQTIGTVIGAEEYGARWFDEASQPPGVLSTDEDMEDQEAEDLRDRWMKHHGGRSQKPAVLSGGLKWTPISIKPDEAQFLETIKAKREEIAGFYRVAPHMIGMVDKSTSWGSGIEEQALGFITYTMGIWLVRFEAAVSSLLPASDYVKFNVASLLRGRLTERYQAYTMGRFGGWLSADEIRAKEEMPPLDEGLGGTYLQPMNTVIAGAEERSGLSIEELTLALQKIYLSVGKVITAEEAREILNRGGAGLGPISPELQALMPSVTDDGDSEP